FPFHRQRLAVLPAPLGILTITLLTFSGVPAPRPWRVLQPSSEPKRNGRLCLYLSSSSLQRRAGSLPRARRASSRGSAVVVHHPSRWVVACFCTSKVPPPTVNFVGWWDSSKRDIEQEWRVVG